MPSAARPGRSRRSPERQKAFTRPVGCGLGPSTRSARFNWGIATGTLYLNRKETRNARDAGYIVALAAGVCSAGFPICFPITAQAGGIGIAAARYYEEGNCVKLKVIGPTLKPERHKKGQRNCK
ncbi:hypothetical protein G3I20_27545 [Streptomyces sp. SID8111]|uniref:hypothetical protein n=1 Tax=Streptomyces sp. SID8111 TaxID=2706100 RepID=UPI0013C155C0|nr:hypothetical protein [Streptomyces sp. SID8111]NEC30247.1 hypothetical protein [Streptomyces sp. SID8111]